MVPYLRGEGGEGLSVGRDSSNEIERGGAGLRGSALHPKILCELLDLQEIFSVDCGTGGGQGPQHVRLQTKDPNTPLSFITADDTWESMLDLTMQTIGSKSLSLGTSIQVISMAAGSPGEQGVKRSSTITWLLLRDGPRTCGKSGV